MKLVNRMFGTMTALCAILVLAGTAAASDIANVTTTVTDLFVDLIPLIIILGVFGLILAAVKFRK